MRHPAGCMVCRETRQQGPYSDETHRAGSAQRSHRMKSMPSYQVLLGGMCRAVLYVEAETAEEAEKMVLDDDPDPDWRIEDVFVAQVLEADEL
jgi:hypothetical protein